MGLDKAGISTFLLFAILSCPARQAGASQNGQHGTRKSSKKPQQKLLRYETAPFDPSLQLTLPPDYLGDDPKLLISALARRQQPQKSEYETTQDFEKRVEQEASRPLFGTVKPTDMLALDLGLARQRYDADAGVLQAWVNLAPASIAKDQYDDARDALLFPTAEPDNDKEYLGTNGFGATRTIYVSERTDAKLVISRIQPPLRVVRDQEFRPGERVNLDAVVTGLRVSSVEARDIRSRLHALMICKLTAPYLTHWDEHEIATFTSPFDETTHVQRIYVVPYALWFYDQKTGRVYQKIDLRSNGTPPAS